MVLDGVKVIDTTRWVFWPFGTTCLSDMGADAIKGRRSRFRRRLSAVKPEIDHSYSELGQHTEEILLETSNSWDDIEKLKDAKIIP
ncbi:MAG: CoA transferase [bacterium]